MRYPEVLYETPSRWGIETLWVSRTELMRMVDDARRNLGWLLDPRHARPWLHLGGGYYAPRNEPGTRLKFRYDRSTQSWRPCRKDE